jgi:FADH2 O2-dependent halogenase
MSTDFDLAVVGSGFAGSLLAMIGKRLGLSVVLLERGRHPRFAIGESSTPLANLLLEELAARYDLPGVASLSKWGTWQMAHAKVACGLKRGFTFFHHHRGQPWETDGQHRNQLLVAASPHDGVADTHWYRPDFDQYLVQQAQTLGVEFLDEVELTGAHFAGGGSELFGRRANSEIKLRASLVVDATGPRGFLHRQLRLPETHFPLLPRTQALFTHFQGVNRWEKLRAPGETPPYPVDDAAVHHVFEGGWIWVLRFNNGVTSAGVAATPGLAEELRLAEGQAAWERLLTRLPSVKEQFVQATATLPFVHTSRLPFRSEIVAGEGWLLLPSAAGFVDPLLSTGFPLTLLGLERVAHGLEKGMAGAQWAAGIREYSSRTLAELDVTAELVGALYAQLNDFEVFAALTWLYFAAAMYSETVRRLGRPERMNGFLQHEHESFGPALRRCMGRALLGPLAGRDRAEWFAEVRATIQPFNLAGLGEPPRRNWYPARAADLLGSAAKLGVDPSDIAALLARCGFTPV